MLMHYFQIAARTFLRNKFHTAINVIGLAIGLACFVGAYVVVDYVNSFDKDFPGSDRIYTISQATRIAGQEFGGGGMPLTSPPVAKYLKADLPQLEAVARAIFPQETGVKAGAEKSFQQIEFVDPEFLDIFHMPMKTAGSGNPLEHPHSALLTKASAERLFGNKDPIGQTILLNNKLEVTVQGVIDSIPSPSHLQLSSSGKPPDMFVSMDSVDAINGTGASLDETWISIFCFTYAMLPADGSLTAAGLNQSLATFGERHMPKEQGEARFSAAHISQFSKSLVDSFILQGAGGISITDILFLLGGMVLLTACLNYANLAIAGVLTRGREVGMRKVMGARQPHVLVQYFLEAVLLVVAALAIALLIIKGLTAALASASGFDIAMPWGAGLSFWVFLLGVVLAVAAVAGGYPAWLLARVRPIQALRAGGMKAGPRRLRTLLVGIQFTTASFLMIAVIVVAGHNAALKRTGMTAHGDQEVIIDNSLLSAQIDPETFRTALLLDPAIKSVTFSQFAPWALANNITSTSKSPDPAATLNRNQRYNVSYDYFKTLDIPVLAGRTFLRDRSNDIWPGFEGKADRAVPVHAVIDDYTAQKMGWSDPQDAVGKTIYAHMPAGLGNDTARIVETQIIGVVAYKPLKLVSMGLETSIYYLDPKRAAVPIIKVSGDNVPGALAHIDAVWSEMAPNLPLKRAFMDETFDQAYAVFQAISGVLTIMTLLAVLVATLGLFGMAALVTRRRTHEIGVRKTLGAGTSRILKMLLWDFSRPVLIANIIAWPFAFVVMMGYLSLFTIRIPLSPVPFVASLIITVLIAWIAVGGQAWKAARTKPANVLRYE